MDETTAQKKFQCAACGADAFWDPKEQALVCAHCGTKTPVNQNAADNPIIEYDLLATVQALGKQDQKTGRVSVRCQSCQAISLFEANRVAQRCEFCGSTAIIPYEQTQALIHPESILPFKVSDAEVRDALKQWVKSRWFAPGQLKSGAMLDQVRGVYLPYWTFDAQTRSEWTAESGYHYYTTETYRDSNGETKTRQVQHTRWQPSSGVVERFVNDDIVCASVGADSELLRKVEPIPTNELVPYQPGFVAGWVVEQYQIDLEAGAQKSRERIRAALYNICAGKVPGDTHRNLQVYATFSNQTFKHILVPIWIMTFGFGSKKYQVIANGYTGKIAGKHPVSFLKILFLVVAIVLAVMITLLVAKS